MKSLNQNVETQKQEALEVVIVELERSLAVLEENYRLAVTNLNTLRQCVDTDDLTRLLRRGAFMKKLSNLLERSQIAGKQVCLMMIDVDHFKQVNDGHGHQTGDVVLERISELVKGYMRQDDLAGRFGGEEIIVAMQANDAEASAIAERIRCAVEEFRIKSLTKNIELHVTLSLGIASSRSFGFDADTLIAEADAALYSAKRTGRNRIVAAGNVTAAA